MKTINTLILILFTTLLFAQNNNRLNIEINTIGSQSFLSDDNTGKRISVNYDSIKQDDNYYFGYKKDMIVLFDKENGKQLLNKIRSIYTISEGEKVYQILKGNETFWINKNGKLLTMNPLIIPDFSLVCGTVNSYQSKLILKDGRVFYQMVTSQLNGRKAERQFDITTFTGNTKITFLNKMGTLEYDDNNNFLKELDNLTFIQTNKQHKKSIFKLQINEDSTVEKILLLKEADVIFSAMQKSPFELFSPFQFQKNGLYGLYPYNKIARYKFMNQSSGKYTKFILPNGTNGWLDTEGKEYLDQ